MPPRLMAVAAATQRIGFVCIQDGKVIDWAMSRAASRSPKKAAKRLRGWIANTKPDAVITERLDKNTRKGAHARDIIEALAREAEHHELYDISVVRKRRFANKYEEAAAYAARFREVAHLLPSRPRLWQSEPKKMIYFEAIALALAVIDPQPEP